MKFFVIPPTKHMSLVLEGSAGMYVLAHLWLKDESYRQEVLNIKGMYDHYALKGIDGGTEIILDNSAAERSLVTPEALIEIVKALKPTFVIPPDVLFDKNQTIEKFDEFNSMMENEGLYEHTSLLACPQGSNKQEWLDCYQYMASHHRVKKIGLSKISVPFCFYNKPGEEFKQDMYIKEGRNECVKYLQKMNWLITPIHCLGMGDPTEYFEYKDIPQIVTSDSCYSVLAGINGISFAKNNFTRVPTPDDYFEKELTTEQLTTSISNANWLSSTHE